jgi:hypothetical protein
VPWEKRDIGGNATQAREQGGNGEAKLVAASVAAAPVNEYCAGQSSERGFAKMPRTSGLKKTRFTLWLSDDVLKDLTRQQELGGKGSVAEVVREAVDVYRSFLRARDEGWNLYFEDTSTGEKGRVWMLPGAPPARKPKR